MSALDPEYRLLGWVTPAGSVRPRTLTWARLGVRASAAVMRPHRGVRLRRVVEQGVPVHVLSPQAGSEPAALLWMHGGGLVMGAPTLEYQRASSYAAALGITVVVPSYRLAPEHPWPAALDDCRSAWTWLLQRADSLGVDPTRVVVGGVSAGGGLAAALAQRLHDEGGTQPAGELLVYPMLDDRTAADTTLDAHRHPVWNNVSNRTGWTSYLGHPPGRPDVVEYAVAARRADLSGLPPTWIGVGTADLFLEECRAYAHRLRQAGVPTELVEVPGAPHGFDTLTTPQRSVLFWQSQLAFLTDRLRLPASAGSWAARSLPSSDWIDRAPVRVEAAVDIAAPPSQVWPVLVDHAGWAQWFSGVTSVVVTGRASGVGSRRRLRAGPLRFDEVCTAWQPREHLALAVASSNLPLLQAMAQSVRLEATPRGTRLTHSQGLAARPGFDRLLELTWAPAARRLAASLDVLARSVEG